MSTDYVKSQIIKYDCYRQCSIAITATKYSLRRDRNFEVEAQVDVAEMAIGVKISR